MPKSNGTFGPLAQLCPRPTDPVDLRGARMSDQAEAGSSSQTTSWHDSSSRPQQRHQLDQWLSNGGIADSKLEQPWNSLSFPSQTLRREHLISRIQSVDQVFPSTADSQYPHVASYSETSSDPPQVDPVDIGNQFGYGGVEMPLPNLPTETADPPNNSSQESSAAEATDSRLPSCPRCGAKVQNK